MTRYETTLFKNEDGFKNDIHFVFMLIKMMITMMVVILEAPQS